MLEMSRLAAEEKAPARRDRAKDGADTACIGDTAEGSSKT
jgi:hypothetical protein